MRRFLKYGVFLLCLSAPFSALAGDLPLPEGWRQIELEDVKDAGMFSPWMEEKPNYGLKASADIDENGMEDQIRYLQNIKTAHTGVFVSMQMEKGTRHFVIADYKSLSDVYVGKVSVPSPGAASGFVITCEYNDADCEQESYADLGDQFSYFETYIYGTDPDILVYWDRINHRPLYHWSD